MAPVNEVFAVGGLLSAFGLSSAAGLNATLPLLVVGVLSRLGHLELSGSYGFLRSTPTLVVLAVLFIVDVVGDKIPGVDHVLHLIGIVAYPVAGAVAFASQNGVISHIPTPLALALGLTTAGGLHVARSALRPVVTAATFGIGNPIISSAEDVTSAAVTALALALPVVAVIIVVLLLLGVWRLLRRARLRLASWRQPVASP